MIQNELRTLDAAECNESNCHCQLTAFDTTVVTETKCNPNSSMEFFHIQLPGELIRDLGPVV